MILRVDSFVLTIYTPPSDSNNAFKSSFDYEEHEEHPFVFSRYSCGETGEMIVRAK